MSNIVIIGYGNIGQHVQKELSVLHPDIYDPLKGFDTLHKSFYDIAIICVPTERQEDGTCDTSIVESVILEVPANVYLIKSTIPVGSTERFAQQTGKHLVFSPEYYGTTQHSSESPNFLILGGERKDCDKIAQIYYKVKNGAFKITYTDFKTAELAKYMENAFLALKVSFCCEFYNLAQVYGISYPELREIFVQDERMGNSHTFVYDEHPYYDSHCLNKDIPALLTASPICLPLLETMYEINEARKLTHLSV